MTKKELVKIIEEMSDDSKVYIDNADVGKIVLMREKSGILDFLSKDEIFIFSQSKSR